MTATTARTVTTAAKRAIRLAGLAGVVVKVSTHDNGNGTFSTHVETIHDASKATQEKVVTALKAERFAVEGVTTEAARFAFAPVVADVVPFRAVDRVDTGVVIGHVSFPDGMFGTGQNTDEKRRALCAKAREVSAVGTRPRQVSARSAELIERGARLAARLEQGRVRLRAANPNYAY